MKKFNLLEIGRLAPCVLLLAGLLDVGLRFVPIDALAFRPWEAVLHNHLDGAPFEANMISRKDNCYGDLANMANLPGLRQYRSETFTTDSFGYRKTPVPILQSVQTDGFTIESYELADPPEPDAIQPDVLVMGDSFTAGAGLNDRETFPAELSRISGLKIYNGGGVQTRLSSILALAQKLHMSKGTVIVEFFERDYPGEPVGEFLKTYYPKAITQISGDGAGMLLNSLLEYPVVQQALEKLRPVTDSRLKILAEKTYRLLQNGRFFPNLPGNSVCTKQLRDGSAMCFNDRDLDFTGRNVIWAAPYFSWLETELKLKNFSLLVFLLPEKYTVYRSLLTTPDEPQTAGEQEYLGKIEDQLVKSGVPVVNVTAALKAAAARALEHGDVLYWRDDSHWNAMGAAVAASTVWTYWKSSEVKPKPAQGVHVGEMDIGDQ